MDRPPMIAANEILSGGRRIVLMSNGERFRRQRKTVHTHLQPKAVETYKDMLFEQAKILILDLLDDPKNHQKVAHRYVYILYVACIANLVCIASGFPHQSSCALPMADQAPSPSMTQRSLGYSKSWSILMKRRDPVLTSSTVFLG